MASVHQSGLHPAAQPDQDRRGGRRGQASRLLRAGGALMQNELAAEDQGAELREGCRSLFFLKPSDGLMWWWVLLHLFMTRAGKLAQSHRPNTVETQVWV